MNWINLKKRPTHFADAKNAPGTDYASKINETHQKPKETTDVNPEVAG